MLASRPVPAWGATLKLPARCRLLLCSGFCAGPHGRRVSSALCDHTEPQPLYRVSPKPLLHTVPNSTETLFDRAFSRTGFFLLRLALWPSLVFVAFQAGATYAISTLLPFQGRFAVTRSLIAGGASALMSALVLAAMWSVLFGMISH